MTVETDFQSPPQMIVKGFSNAKLTKFEGFDKNLLSVQMDVPNAVFGGPYKVKARVLFIPFNNAGNFQCDMSINFKSSKKFYGSIFF